MDFDLAIIAGEPSGDEHAASMLKELFQIDPTLKIAAVAGTKMIEAYPLHQILHIDNLSIMGFVDVLKNSVKLYRHYRTILQFLLQNNVKKILLVDYPGMNLQLMKALRKKDSWGQFGITSHQLLGHGSKIAFIHYKKIATNFFAYFLFEEEFFRSHSIQASYIGHPLVSKIVESAKNTPKTSQLISIFPGSRKHEIIKNIAIILKACEEFLKYHPEAEFAISVAKPEFQTFIDDALRKISLKTKVTLFDISMTQEMMSKSRLAIAKSGTCNLELALHKTPVIVVYAVSKLDQFIAQKLFKINLPFYSLPNLIMKKAIVTELYGSNFNQMRLFQSMMKEFEKDDEEKPDLEELTQKLGLSNPSQVLADRLFKSLVKKPLN